MAETREGMRKWKIRIIWLSSGVIAAAAIALSVTFAATHTNGNSGPSDISPGNVQPKSNVLLSDECGFNNDEGLYEPATIILTCGDGSAVANSLTWSQWGSNTAIGQGTVNEMSCVPDCAEGKDAAYRANLELSEPVKAEDGHEYFTRIAISIVGNAPSGYSSQLFKDCADSPVAPYIPRCPADEQGAT